MSSALETTGICAVNTLELDDYYNNHCISQRLKKLVCSEEAQNYCVCVRILFLGFLPNQKYVLLVSYAFMESWKTCLKGPGYAI